MTGWALSDYFLAFTLTCLALIPIFLLIYRIAEQGASQAPAMPDWPAIGSYVDLTDAAWHMRANLTPEGFLDGPFRRFLELASDPAGHPRGRARIMEFARSALGDYCGSLGERGGDGPAFAARARAIAAEWFARPDVPNGEYMLEVLDGLSNHNWRGTL